MYLNDTPPMDPEPPLKELKPFTGGQQYLILILVVIISLSAFTIFYGLMFYLDGHHFGASS
jgi:hypothetical protein